jgi:hypothetical protein
MLCTLNTAILKNAQKEPIRLYILPYGVYIKSGKVIEFLLVIKITVFYNVVIADSYK